MSSNKLPSGTVGAVFLFLIGALVGGVGHGIGEHSTKRLFDHGAGTADPVQGRGNYSGPLDYSEPLAKAPNGEQKVSPAKAKPTVTDEYTYSDVIGTTTTYTDYYTYSDYNQKPIKPAGRSRR